jgi:hypothetical protein
MTTSDMAKRNAAARARGFRSYAQQRTFGASVRNRSELAALPPRAQRAREQTLDVLATARRDGTDLATAAQREGIAVDVVAFWARDVVTRRRGRWHVAASDRLFRPMYVYSAGQVVPVDVRGSLRASTVGRYHAAVQQYLNTGDDSRLRRLAGVTVGGVELETDLDVLDELARRGAFNFESIYRMVS